MAIFPPPNQAAPGSSRLRAEAEAHAASLGQVRGTPGWGGAVRDYVLNEARRHAGQDARYGYSAPGSQGASAGHLGPEQGGVELAQIPPEMRGRFRTPEMMGISSPARHFGEDDQKHFDWGSLFAPALPSFFPP